MRNLAVTLIFLSFFGCGTVNQQHYHDMPPPLALYFDGGIRHLSFSAKLALLDRIDYMNAHPQLKAEIIGYAANGQASQLTQIVEREFLSQGISAQRLQVREADHARERPPQAHVAIRLQ